MFTLKTIFSKLTQAPSFTGRVLLTTLIGTSVAGSLVALPVRANEDNLAESNNVELILSQANYRESYPNAEPADDLKNLIGLTGLAIGTGIVGYHLSRAYKPSLANLPTANKGGTISLDRVSPKLRRELLRLVHNQQTASRLLSGTSNSHPGRSANWVAEKVIYDLKRDR